MTSTILKQKPRRPSKCPVRLNRVHPLPKTTDAVAIIHKRFIEGRPELEEYLVEERERLMIAGWIYDLRTKAGMTQAILARKVGLKAADINRLEEADYEGHSLPTLRKIAAVFGMRLEFTFVPLEK